MSTASVKHFATCNGATVQLLDTWYPDLKQEYERFIGKPYAGEKLVRECQLFAAGHCPNCGSVHATERRIYFASNPSAKNIVISLSVAIGGTGFF